MTNILLIIFFFNMKSQDNNTKYIHFGAGCFWCVEAIFEGLDGVEEVVSGYSGGEQNTANYKDVISGKTKHAEVCRIKYNPNIISFQTLLKVFFLAHNPTTLNRQGNDVGEQYRSIIFYNNESEKLISEQYIQNLVADNIYDTITTDLVVFKEFYQAEQYHQNYMQLNPEQPYCKLIINPKVKKLRQELNQYYKN